jgi:hypothetical protein
MIRGILPSLAAAMLAGCVVSEEAPRLPDIFEVCSLELAKLREVRTGMAEAEVTRLMGPPSLRIFNGYRYEHEARPHRREVRKIGNGWEVVVLYYRARVVHHDTVCTLDETEAVLLVNGKVDAVMHGDAVEAFLRKF